MVSYKQIASPSVQELQERIAQLEAKIAWQRRQGELVRLVIADANHVVGSLSATMGYLSGALNGICRCIQTQLPRDSQDDDLARGILSDGVDNLPNPALTADMLRYFPRSAERLTRVQRLLAQINQASQNLPTPSPVLLSATRVDEATRWLDQTMPDGSGRYIRIDDWSKPPEKIIHTIHVDVMEPPAWISIDAGLLSEMVLKSLLENAIKYSPSGGDIWVRMFQRDGWGLIEVSDSGIGVPPQFHRTIFRFGDRGNAGARGIEGTGQALWLVKYLVDSYHGEISVASSGVEGEGATFTIKFPVIPPPDSE